MSRVSLSRNVLKYIAVAAMLLDHAAWAFVPFYSAAGQAMHFIGRFTAPIMCYFVAEGYFHTRNVRKYLLRLGIFALISWFPFAWFELGEKMFVNGNFLFCQSVIFTLFLGLLALHIWNSDISSPKKTTAIAALCAISIIGDWAIFGVMWILFFGVYHGNLKAQLRSYYLLAFLSIASIIVNRFNGLISGETPVYTLFWQLGLLAAPLPLLAYNGERGSGKAVHKWFFYIFYPAHLLILCIIKYLL